MSAYGWTEDISEEITKPNAFAAIHKYGASGMQVVPLIVVSGKLQMSTEFHPMVKLTDIPRGARGSGRR